MERGEPVVASVLVGSVNGGESIHVLLDALDRQVGNVSFEVVVADRCEDGTAERIERERPHVKVLRAPATTTLPELRTRALERSRGRFILVTEDHTVPPPRWVADLTEALEKSGAQVAAVGGPVDNAMRDRSVDWAAFLCEYSGYLPPLEAGPTRDVPGVNVCYRREHLEATERESLTRGFWESTVHPRLLASGYEFVCLPQIVMGHRKRFGFFYFLSQRYHYSRYYAGVRFSSGMGARRLLYAALSPALPALVMMRVCRAVWRRPPYRRPLARSLAALLCFSVAWGVGELVGYVRGPGNSLREIE